jgi:hypothetical protein
MPEQLGRPYNFLATGSTNIQKVRSGDCVLQKVIVSNLSAEARAVNFFHSETEPNLASAVAFVTLPIAKESAQSFLIELPVKTNLWHSIVKKPAALNAEAVTAGDVRLTIVTR